MDYLKWRDQKLARDPELRAAYVAELRVRANRCEAARRDRTAEALRERAEEVASA